MAKTFASSAKVDADRSCRDSSCSKEHIRRAGERLFAAAEHLAFSELFQSKLMGLM